MVTETVAQRTARRLARWNRFVERRSGAFMFHVNCAMPEQEAQLPPEPALPAVPYTIRVPEDVTQRGAHCQTLLRIRLEPLPADEPIVTLVRPLG